MNDQQRVHAPSVSESRWLAEGLGLREIWCGKWRLLIATSICVSLGTAYLVLAQPVFRAEARILVQKESFGFADDSPLREDRKFLATQAEIIACPLTIRRALESAAVSLPLGTDADPVSFVLSSLRVTPLANTDILNIGYRSGNPGEAARFIKALVNSYRRYLKEVERNTSLETLRLLAQRDEELRNQLELLQNQYVEHRKGSPLVGQGHDTIHLEAEFLRQLGQGLTEARGRRIGLENTIQTIADSEALTETGLPRAVSFASARRSASKPGDFQTGAAEKQLLPSTNGGAGNAMAAQLLRSVTDAGIQDLAELQIELWRTQARQKELAQLYGPRHPQRQAVDEQITWLQQLIRQRENTAATVLQQELAVAKLSEANLAGLYDDERTRVKQLDSYLVREQQLLESTRRLEAMHDSTLVKLSELKLTDQALADGRASVTTRLLDGPELTEDQVWPKPVPILMVCAVLGFAVGCLWIWIPAR